MGPLLFRMPPSDDQHRRLVLRVNELFHDLEGADYQDVHPEIFQQETARWDRMLERHLPAASSARTFVDLGAGTGFVGERLIPRIRAGDTLVCADISSTMLELCVERMQRLRGDITVRPLKMHDERIALPDASADIVTMNSVLHHVPSPESLLAECARVLKPGGLLFIGHEPNGRFFTRSAFLPAQAAFLHWCTPRRIAATVLKKVGIYKSVVRAKADPLLDRVNAALQAGGLTDRPLSRAELSMLIDVHSPTAGGLRREEGFDPFTVLDGVAGLTLRAAETYNHLSKLSGRHLWLRPYEALLARIFPRDGATFFLVGERV